MQLLPDLSSILSIMETALDTIVDTLMQLIEDIIKAAFSILIDDTIYLNVYSAVDGWAGLYIVIGAAMAMLFRKFILTAEKFREGKPLGIGWAWVEDISIGSIVAYHYREVFISLLITPIVFLAGLPTIFIRALTALKDLLIDLFLLVFEAIFKLIEGIFKTIIEWIAQIVDAIKAVVDGIADTVDEILDLAEDILDAIP